MMILIVVFLIVFYSRGNRDIFQDNLYLLISLIMIIYYLNLNEVLLKEMGRLNHIYIFRCQFHDVLLKDIMVTQPFKYLVLYLHKTKTYII